MLYYDYFQDLLRQTNISVKVIAEELGVSIGAVYKWKSGENRPQKHHVNKLAELESEKIKWLTNEEIELDDDEGETMPTKTDRVANYLIDEIEQLKKQIVKLEQKIPKKRKEATWRSSGDLLLDDNSGYGWERLDYDTMEIGGDTVTALGYTHDELNSMRHKEWKKLYHPDSYKESNIIIEMAIKTSEFDVHGGTFRFVRSYKHKVNGYVHFDMEIHFTHNAGEGIMRWNAYYTLMPEGCVC